MSHESTITIGITTEKGKRYFNIPTVYKGKQLSKAAATKRYLQGMRAGKQRPRMFSTSDAAVKAARGRSRSSLTHKEARPRGRISSRAMPRRKVGKK